MTNKDAAREYASQWASNPNYVEVAEDSFLAGVEHERAKVLAELDATISDAQWILTGASREQTLELVLWLKNNLIRLSQEVLCKRK